MEFFTVDLWMGLQTSPAVAKDWDTAQAAYNEHLDRIRERLPEGARTFADGVSLHDANVRALEIDVPAGTAQMTLHGDDGSGGSRMHFVTYRGLAAVRSLGDPEKGLEGPWAYGDYGYDEFDVTAGGLVVHRMLFSCGIEMAFTFEELEHTYMDS